MCGLLFQENRFEAIDLEKFDNALSTLAHRGPDGQDHWLHPQRQRAIGHTRLAINGGENGRQPMSSKDELITLAINGEIYNNRKLLISKGIDFSTESDSEILIHLYQAAGIRAIQQLDGEFAFVIWDESLQQTILGRDRHGIKPLFYTQLGDKILAATEIKTLLACGAPKKWNQRYLEQSKYFIADPNETIIQGIYSLPPGHIACIKNGNIEITPYLNASPLNPQEFEELNLSYAQATEEFEGLLLNAVKKRLRKNHKNASYLSGGIDSSIITSIAAEYCTSLTAYTMALPGSELDESRQASQLCKNLDIQHEILPILGDELADNFEASVVHGEMPLPNFNVTAKYLLSKKLNGDFQKTVLTGEGADESLIGYGHFDIDLNADLRSPNEFQKSSSREYPAQFKQASYAGQILDALSSPNNLSFEHIKKLMKNVQPRTPKVQVSQYVHYHSVFQNYILGALADRIEMAHSIEGRPPFLDNELVTFIHRLPQAYKHDGKVNKRILRDVARKYLPKSFCETPKRAFITPPNTLANSKALRDLFDEYLISGENLPEIYDKAKVRKVVTQDVTDKINTARLEPILTHLASLCALQKHFSLSL